MDLLQDSMILYSSEKHGYICNTFKLLSYSYLNNPYHYWNQYKTYKSKEKELKICSETSINYKYSPLHHNKRKQL